MTIVLSLLLVNAALGAWDTLWYHEIRTKLASRIDRTGTELRLHAARDAVYAVLYGGLAWWRPSGLVVAIVVVLLGAEIVITLADFVVEDRDRPSIGGIAPGERVLHSLMAIVYGAMLVRLVPLLAEAWSDPTGVFRHDAHGTLSVLATLAAIGIAISGVRDAAAVAGFDPIWSRAEGGADCSGEPKVTRARVTARMGR